MISYIKGILTEVDKDGIIVENQGMGYEIRVPLSVMNELPALGREIKVFTYMQVKEDGASLFGFLSKEELSLFKLLITVNGIGPKGALGILSSISVEDLRFAVLADDAKTIAKAPGIGYKTAGKLILELKDKLSLPDSMEAGFSGIEKNLEGSKDSGSKIRSDVIQALTALGYSNTEALKAVRAVEMTDEMDVEEVLKLSLKKIMVL